MGSIPTAPTIHLSSNWQDRLLMGARSAFESLGMDQIIERILS